jgi:hypothetical protein
MHLPAKTAVVGKMHTICRLEKAVPCREDAIRHVVLK